VVLTTGNRQRGAAILTNEQRIRWIAKPLVFVLCLTPLTWLGWQAFAGGLDPFFAWGEIWADIVKRNYITVGMIALALLVPLALTSTKGMIKRLGGRRWKKLHMLVYPAAILGVFHFLMMVKADIREPLIYAAVLAVLLGYRVLAWGRRRFSRTVRSVPKTQAA
jgi:DMSO/TMAO reductase YedYZ heme-binding membrane subunit